MVLLQLTPELIYIFFYNNYIKLYIIKGTGSTDSKISSKLRFTDFKNLISKYGSK